MKDLLVSVGLLLGFHGFATGEIAPEALEGFSGKSELESAVYPLGWAENGDQLALLIAQPNEAADEREWKMVLTDLISDKVAFSKTFRFGSDDGFRAFWSVHGQEIEGLCRKHGIERASMKIHPFPALLGRRGQDIYEVEVRAERAEEPNFLYTGINQLVVTLSQQGARSKEILKKSWKEWFPLSAGLVGYIPNPNETRMAVVIGLVQRGYEGPPHTRQVLIVGAGIGSEF